MLSAAIAVQLRARGHDVIAVVEDRGLIGAPDEELLGHATSMGRCLVTANVRDFAALHASWLSRGRSHAGIVYIVNRVFPNDRSFVGAIATALDSLVGSGVLPSDGGEFYLRRRTG
jgi:hypothetical protein